jgi:hypothetical protein
LKDFAALAASAVVGVPVPRLTAAGDGDRTAGPGLPARLVLVDADGRQVDLHPVVFDRHGNGWQDLGADAWAPTRPRS